MLKKMIKREAEAACSDVIEQALRKVSTTERTSEWKNDVLAKCFEKLGIGNSKQERLELAHLGTKYADSVKDKRKEQKKEDGSFRKCPTCGEKELYFSEVCQRQDWRKGHKVVCKVVRAQFKEVTLTRHGLTEKMKKYGLEGEVWKKMFVVKIQAVMEIESMMAVVTEDDGVLGHLGRSSGQEELYDKVRKELVQRGVEVKGALVDGNTCFWGCFYALHRGPTGDGGQKLDINPDRMQPMEAW